MKHAYIAVDFGGGSGRVVAGSAGPMGVELNEIHRFVNRPVTLLGATYWDFPSLYAEMETGLRKAVEAGYHIDSIGIDTWGVDFGLIDADGHLLGNPFCYRSAEVSGVVDEFFGKHGTQSEHYSEAGIQIMDINTVFRLSRMTRTHSAMLKAADRLLFTPDLFSYFLTGEANNEYTISTTSGLIDAKTRQWNRALIERIGVPERLFGEIVMPGTVRGYLTADVMKRIGVDYDVPVVAVGSHDTASAVHAVGETYSEHRSAFLSSGTWSLLGVVLDNPLLTEEARQADFTNEGGVGGSIRFLQNITGLWILQCLMKEWEAEGLDTSYTTMLAGAEQSDCRCTIDVDDSSFHAPHSMKDAIAQYCREHGGEEPRSQADYVRCVLQSLALRYKKGIDGLNRLLPEPIERLVVIGGGSRNGLLNRLTAEATGVEVVCGEVESTAVGNILVQAQAAENRK